MKSLRSGKRWERARSKHFSGSGNKPLQTSSAVNEKIDRFGQVLGDICGNATAEELHQCRTLRSTDDHEIHTHRSCKIDNRRGGVLTHGVKRNHIDAALAPE